MPKHFAKADIDFHRDGWGPAHAAVNVKARDFGGRDALERLQTDFGGDTARAEKALECAYESATEDFWRELAPMAAAECLVPTFGGPIKCYSEGRSSGWLVPFVGNSPLADRSEVQGWDAIRVAAWGRFEYRLRAEIEYLCSYDWIKDTISANGWLEREYEANGLVEVGA